MRRKLCNIISCAAFVICLLVLSGCTDNAIEHGAELISTANQYAEQVISDAAEILSAEIKDEFSGLSTEVIEEDDISPVQGFDEYIVSYVIDGDTFAVDDGTRTVRLIGVDTPESKASEEYTLKTGKENCKEGKIASEFTKDLLKKGTTVYLEYDAATEDIYGRTLAYVYLEDGQMLQNILLENGMARIMTIQPNSKYADRFLKEQENARENSMGFWDTGFYKD